MEKFIRSRNIKIVPIGNSMGVRLPKKLLQKYGFAHSLVLEETDRGLLLRSTNDNKLSWTDTYKAMANESEDWSDYDSTLTDGLEEDDWYQIDTQFILPTSTPLLGAKSVKFIQSLLLAKTPWISI